MRIDTATADDIHAVALHMRDADLREFLALTPAHNRVELAHLLTERYTGRDDVLCASVDGVPVAVGGLIEARPNVVTLMFFATPKLKKIGKQLTRAIKQQFLRPMIDAGAHRIECVSMEGHEDAHRWIRALGLTQEAPVLRSYGANGENFIQFSWVGDVR